jgi:hypothetical protein
MRRHAAAAAAAARGGGDVWVPVWVEWHLAQGGAQLRHARERAEAVVGNGVAAEAEDGEGCAAGAAAEDRLRQMNVGDGNAQSK